MKNMHKKMPKNALEMVKYVPKIAKYADYAKMHKTLWLFYDAEKWPNMWIALNTRLRAFEMFRRFAS